MNDSLRRLGLLLWRLVPANPILVRVVHGASRRVRHLWVRFAYLTFLLLVVLVFIVSSGETGGATLSEMAKNASTIFMVASIAQLLLMCFLAPVFTAGAITQERDAQTFNILISTPLSNAQIVLGSLMSRLYFVFMLLLAGLPIFLMLMVYGGVTFSQIVQSFAIAGCTATLTGTLAICISMIGVGTRRTILSFYVMIGLYLLLIYALGQWAGTWIDEAPANTAGQRLSWLAPYHPFLSLDVALNRVPAPDVALLAGRGSIARLLLAYPHHAYVFITLVVSAGMVVVAVFFVRQPKEGEVGILKAVFARISGREIGDRRRKPRNVWNNPVAWREARSRASAATRGFLNVILIGGGLIAAISLVVFHMEGAPVVNTAERLAVVVMVELGLVLLAATNTAATAMTKEKESQTMDLLLTTPLTSRYIVWGKLRGLVTFTLPLIAIPSGTMLVFGVHGLFAPAGRRVVPIEAALEIALIMFAYAAAACLFALTVSLHSRKTVRAVMISVGSVVFVCVILTVIGNAISEGGRLGGAFAAPFAPFTGVRMLADPTALFDSPAQFAAAGQDKLRLWSAIGTVAASTVYLAFIAAGYRSMVHNFDRVMRRQSAQM